VQDDEGAASSPATVSLEVSLIGALAASCWTTESGRTLTAWLPAKPQGFKDPVHYSFVTDGKKGTVAVLDPRTGDFQYTPTESQ
jgi:hypothetical protein